MSKPALRDHLPTSHVLHMLAMLALLAAPHLARLPLWLSAVILGLGIWRAVAAQRALAMPRALLRNLVAVLLFAGIYAQYGTLNGHYAGVALLLGMLAMKLTEMTRRRDYLLVIYLSYFLLITHFLFSQELVMLPLLFAGALAITLVLIEVNHPQGPMPPRQLLGIGGRLILQSIPLMLIFFVLFPRIPGPLWGLPSNAGAGMTGLSDSMEPGSISNLSQSDAVAFRVRFEGEPPPRNQLYWRGPVFEFFNGRGWLPGAVLEFPRPIDIRPQSAPLNYEIQLEPHGDKWLLALDLPSGPLPAKTEIGPDLVLRNRYDIIDKMLFRLQAVTDYQAEPELAKFIQQRNLAIPRRINPKAQELARAWRESLPSDTAIINEALRHIRRENFSYTLQPPLLLSNDTIDEFLFTRQAGFCEHYASAFTFLMRAAGIPARIVTGYQGAEPNGDYYIVRQSDAHAWSEVWLAGQGWVRVDPTGAVAPERIEYGLGAALPESSLVPRLARPGQNVLFKLQLGWDKINAGWNRWILAYGPELQQKFLAAMGLPSLRAILIALTGGIVLSLLIVGLLVSRGFRSQRLNDPVLREWTRFQQKLRRKGIAVRASEGPQDLARRIAQERPDWRGAAQAIADLYIRLRYASSRLDEHLLSRLRQRVRRFPRND